MAVQQDSSGIFAYDIDPIATRKQSGYAMQSAMQVPRPQSIACPAVQSRLAIHVRRSRAALRCRATATETSTQTGGWGYKQSKPHWNDMWRYLTQQV